MKVKDMKKIIENLDDDFEIEVRIQEEVPKETLAKMGYPYPYRNIDAELQFHDIGYSDKVVCFGVYPQE